MINSIRKECMRFFRWCVIMAMLAVPCFVYGFDFGGQLKKLKDSTSGLKDDLKYENKQFKENTNKAKEAGENGVNAVKKTFEDITPEQEYYIGRAVAASILSTYKPYNNKKAQNYINVLGQTLAQASDLPETFGGYHFMILDSDDINAFAAPGGLVFVTLGLLKCCNSEDEAAAVLAHEIGHIQYRHGLQAIKKSRITNVLTVVAVVGASAVAGQQMNGLTSSFGGSVSDITTTINKGYSRSFERQADEAAMTIMKRVGYNPKAMVGMLNEMDKRLKPGGIDFAKTHPSPKNRIADLKSSIGEFSEVKTPEGRKTRFEQNLRKA